MQLMRYLRQNGRWQWSYVEQTGAGELQPQPSSHCARKTREPSPFLNISAHNTRHNNFPAFISIIKPTSFHRCPFHPIPARSRPSAARKTMRQRNDIVFNFLILLHFVVNKRYGRFEVFLIALGEINYFPPTEKMLPPSWAFTSKDFPKGSESQLKWGCRIFK